MKLRFNVLFQMSGAVIQLANEHGALVPATYQWLLAIVVGVAQLVVSVKAHFSNPDGTPATTAYRADGGTAAGE
jgi:hypothetical protein